MKLSIPGCKIGKSYVEGNNLIQEIIVVNKFLLSIYAIYWIIKRKIQCLIF